MVAVVCYYQNPWETAPIAPIFLDLQEEMMVEIIPYQSSWPFEFREIAATLRQGLGELASRIDHIGSTAVPGLAAKDVIDIQITVTELS
jgi:GrpB-like predicted nucleotidyltransferase (UPF0157 family)